MGSRKLSLEQQVLLNQVDETYSAKKNVYMDAKRRADLMVEQEVAAATHASDLAIRKAVEAGVPKRRIYTLPVVGTLNPKAVEDALERTGTHARTAESVGTFSWISPAERLVRVRYRNFPTTSIKTDYPEMLSGHVQQQDDGSWKVTQDDSDIVTEYGNIDGDLRWEIARAGEDSETHPNLAGLLTKWAETA